MKPTVTASEVVLESRSLRATLRVEVEHEDLSFSGKSCLVDLRKAAEGCLPAALLTVAPPALRQILLEVEALLVQTVSEELTSAYSLMGSENADRTELHPSAE